MAFVAVFVVVVYVIVFVVAVIAVAAGSYCKVTKHMFAARAS